MTMKTSLGWMIIAVLFLATPIFADTVILHDGSSYSGHLTDLPREEITFTDAPGVQYKFPVADVQTLVFTPSADTVTLRSGKVYSGRYEGPKPIAFQDAEGIAYQFPVKDVESLVFSRPRSVAVVEAGDAKVIPEGTEVSIRTADPSIPPRHLGSSIPQPSARMLRTAAEWLQSLEDRRPNCSFEISPAAGMSTVPSSSWICSRSQ